jgi:hypothetical protein
LRGTTQSCTTMCSHDSGSNRTPPSCSLYNKSFTKLKCTQPNFVNVWLAIMKASNNLSNNVCHVCKTVLRKIQKMSRMGNTWVTWRNCSRKVRHSVLEKMKQDRNIAIVYNEHHVEQIKFIEVYCLEARK